MSAKLSSGPIRLALVGILASGALLAVVTLTSIAANTIVWETASTGLPSSGLVRDVAFGDVNNDGKPDLVIVGVGGFGVQVYAGNGTGVWSSSGMTIGLPIGGAYERVALGDLNNDGNLDIVATGASNNGVTVWHGNGAGSWISITTGLPGTGSGSFTGVALGDVNQDGRLDVIAGGNGGVASGIKVYLNNTSSFSQTVSPTTTGSYNELTVGYVDNDGYVDLVAGNNLNGVYFWRGASNNGWIFTSGGLSATTGFRGVALGDINLDGKPDLVTSRTGFSGTNSGGLFAFLWDNMAFHWTLAPNQIPVGGSYGQLELRDINNDGRLDLVAGGWPNQGTSGLYTWLGSAVGFTSPDTVTSTGSIPAISIDDFNRDGLLDLAAGDNANAGALAWRDNGVRDAVGTWTLIASPQITSSPRVLDAADFNRDGDLDVIFSREAGGLNMYLGDGGNAWTYCPMFNSGGGAYTGTYQSAIAGAWDRNSQYPQIIAGRGDNGGIQYFGNITNNCGYFYTYQVTTTGSYRGLSAADIDNNGHMELVAAPSHLLNIGLRLWEENGVSNWQSQPNPVSTGTFCDTALGDLNHDGKDDIAAADCSPGGGGGVTVFRYGRTWSSYAITRTGEYYAIAIGDLNNDGHTDVVAAKNGTSTEQGINVWLNDGTSSGWTEWPSPDTSGQYFDLDLGDVNHDGWLDILAARDGLGVMVWLGDGNGGWTPSNTNLPVTGAFFSSLLDHIDHDGNLDLLTTQFNGGVQLWTSAEAAPPTIDNFQPSGWISTTQSPSVWADVLDSVSGISVTSGLYRYSTDGGSSWSGYLPASISGSNSSTATQIISATSVPFNQDSATQNLIELTASDMVGNVGSAQGVIKIDITPPTVPTILNASHGVAVWSNDNTIDINWSGATDATSGVSGYSVLFDQASGTLPDATVDTFATSFTSPLLSDGNNWYAHVRVRDAAGNWSTIARHSGPFYIDTTPPNNPTSVSSTDHTLGVWSNDPTISMSWSGASDGAGSGVSGYSYVFNTSSGTLPDTTVDTFGTTATSAAQPSGSNKYFHIRTRDAAGNWSTTAVHRGAYWIDVTPPSSSASSPTSSGSTSFVVSWSGSDAHSGIANYDIQYRDTTAGGSWTTWKSATTSTSSTFYGVSGHIYQFRSRARDHAGNLEAYPGVADDTTEVATLDFFVRNPGIEVNQAIQDLNNTVILIAQKRTFVRCYVQSDSGNISGVPARLRVYRGATYKGTLLPANSGATITVRTNPDRAQLNQAYYFDVPTGWLTAGSVRFECEVNTPKKYGENDYSNNLRSTTVNFVNSPTMNIAMIDVDYWYGGSVRHVRSVDRVRLEKWLKAAYPVKTLHVYYGYFDPPYSGLPNVDTVNSDLAWNKSKKVFGAGEDVYWRYYGQALQVDNNTFMRGKSVGTPGNVAAGPTGDTGGWDPDGNFGDWYGGHENGHSYGRAHVHGAPYAGSGKCGDEAGPDASYPYAQGRLSPGTSMWATNTKYGVDWSLSTPLIVTPNWYDVMTYCGPQWISDYTYEAIYARMILEKPVLRPIGPTGVEQLAVFGQIITETNVITLDTFYRVPDGFDSFGRDISGTYHIRLLDTGNSLLADYNFSPRGVGGVGDEHDPVQFITEMVPWITGTQKIVIGSATQALVTRTVSTNVPTVTLQAPGGGITLTGSTVNVSWSAFDADGDPLMFSLDYSADGGATWTPLSGQTPSTTLSIDLDLLPGSPNGKFRVWASDGVNTAFDETDGTFMVANKLPQINSVDPVSGTTYVVSQTISFEASAYDPEDGSLEDSQLEWSSDLDGALGSGSLLQLDTLSIGIHHITLTATDSQNAQSTATTTVIVTSEPNVVDTFLYLPIVLRNS